MDLGHHKNKAFRSCLGRRMNGDRSFDFYECGLIDERFRLWIYSICTICVVYCCNRLRLFGFLCIVEFYSTLWYRHRSIVCRLFAHILLQLLYIFFIGWNDGAPASSPRGASTKSDSSPILVYYFGPIHDDLDVIQQLAFAGNKRPSVSLLQRRILVHGQSDSSGPLSERVERVEVQKISIFPSGGYTEDVLQGLDVRGTSRKRFNLYRGINIYSFS